MSKSTFRGYCLDPDGDVRFWPLAQKPWIVPIPGTTEMAHMLDNIVAASVQFTASELAELNRSVSAIQIGGARLPEVVQVYCDVEAPPKI